MPATASDSPTPPRSPSPPSRRALFAFAAARSVALGGAVAGAAYFAGADTPRTLLAAAVMPALVAVASRFGA